MTKQDNSRQLNLEQENAIDLLIQGKTDREVAESVGVARQTVTTWRLSHADFIAELNRRRADLWGAQTERLRIMVSEAVDVLNEDIRSQDLRLRQAAAIHILRAVGLYGAALPPMEFSEKAIQLDLLLQEAC